MLRVSACVLGRAGTPAPRQVPHTFFSFRTQPCVKEEHAQQDADKSCTCYQCVTAALVSLTCSNSQTSDSGVCSEVGDDSLQLSLLVKLEVSCDSYYPVVFGQKPVTLFWWHSHFILFFLQCNIFIVINGIPRE